MHCLWISHLALKRRGVLPHRSKLLRHLTLGYSCASSMDTVGEPIVRTRLRNGGMSYRATEELESVPSLSLSATRLNASLRRY
jgi:hypothetical protein